MSARFTAILCDDVRLEETGKFLIVGAYFGNLGATEFPVEDHFHLLLKVDGIDDEAKKLSLVMNHVGFKADSRDYDISGQTGDSIVFNVSEVPLRAKHPGDFYIEVAIDGGRRKKIEKITIFDADDS